MNRYLRTATSQQLLIAAHVSQQSNPLTHVDVNRFRTGQGPCRANLHKWSLAQSPSCDCGQQQTMNHIVDTCPLTKFEGGLDLLHEADVDAVVWLESAATAALAK